MSSRREILFFSNHWCKNAVMRKHMFPAKLIQAVLAWTIVLSLMLVWIGAQPRASDFPRNEAFSGLSALQAPDHAATLTTVGKMNRSAEYRHGNDTDVSPFVSDAAYGPTGPDLAADLTSVDQPGRDTCCTVPEARAPPQI
jgi:hypothetical protein